MKKTDSRRAMMPASLRRAVRLAMLMSGLLAGCGVSRPGLASQSGADPIDAADATGLFAPIVATSDAPLSSESGWAEGDTVRDLLRADAQAARAALPPRRAADWFKPAVPGGPGRMPAGPADDAFNEIPGAADRIDVMAIFGVGKALQADISVNGRLFRYRAGRSMPLAGSPADEFYALQAIETPCVRLHKAGKPHTACLLHAVSSHD